MPIVILFIIIISTLFGPKISYIDLSAVAGAVGVALLLVTSKENVKLDKTLVATVVLFIAYFVYILGLQLSVGIESSELLLRTSRALAILLIFMLASRVMIRHGRMIMPLVMLCISIHALFVIAASFSFELNSLLGQIFDNDRVRPLRSSGLVAGFDVAGFFCLVGLLALGLDVVKVRSIGVKLLWGGLLLVACYFTSRVSMVLGVLFFTILVWRLVFSGSRMSRTRRMSALVITFPAIALVAHEVLVVLEVAFDLGLIGVDSDRREAVIARFASTTIEEAGLVSMYFLPSNSLEIIMGSGMDVPTSDVGYVKFVFWHGLIGIVLLLAIHLYLLGKSMSCIRQDAKARSHGLFILGVYTLVFVLTFKNNYLLTRGIWSLLLLLYLHASWLASTTVGPSRKYVQSRTASP